MWEGDVWVATHAARACADVVADGFVETQETEMKGEVDPVTEVDREAEEVVRSVIGHYFPDDHVLGEEGGGPPWDQGRVWIVDPLDGTVNFVRRIPQIAVSVALWQDGTPLVGVIIDVAREEEFVATLGHGATLNDQPISVSSTRLMEDSVIATGFPYDRRTYARSYLAVVEKVMVRSRGVRRMGAAALDLAWVACGRYDGYWEHGGPLGVKPWDLAAGVLLVAEAGGTVTDQTGQSNQLLASATVATNGHIHEDLRGIIVETMPAHLT
jgi:myo-inositol-1(or 4)-monophosphatase